MPPSIYFGPLVAPSILLSLWLVAWPSWASECSFRDGQCTYNVLLNPNGNCGIPGPEVMAPPPGSSMYQMEQKFNAVKSEHENRIRELESSMQRLLRDAIPSEIRYSGPTVIRASATSGPPNTQSAEFSRRERMVNEDTLLMQLQSQFNRMRTTVAQRTADLLDARNKLNETSDLLKETRRQLFVSSNQLAEYETKSAVLEKENRILKNRYRGKTERLEIAEQRLNTSEHKLSALENQLYDVVRSESNLKEELQFYKIKLNSTVKAFESLNLNYTVLLDKYTRTKTLLNLREAELMECFTAKTQTFCGFEDPDICGFTQENATDTFDWIRSKGNTPSVNTGPSTDHTCRGREGIGEGNFMYIEASGKRRGHSAVMYSPKYRGLVEQCVEFYYHMHGRHIGTLTVHSKTLASDERNAVWRVFGNQGNVWILARMSIPEEVAKAGYQMIFEGSTETGYEGDIALDDVKVNDGACDGSNVSSTLEGEGQPEPVTQQTRTDQGNRYRNVRRRQRPRG